MPISKKRKKDDHKKRRDRESRPEPPAAIEPAGGGGLLGKMRGGFRNLTGTGGAKRESWISKLLTWALFALAAYFLAKRFGVIR